MICTRQWLGRFRFNPRLSPTKTSKMVLDAPLLSTQYYNVQIKGKVEQSRKRSSTSLHLGVVANEKGAIRSPTLL